MQEDWLRLESLVRDREVVVMAMDSSRYSQDLSGKET